MDHSSYHASSSPPSPPSPTPSRRDKVIIQRQYREKEGECFTNLRAIIHKLTGEVLQTRHEILTKATQLLLTLAEMRKSREVVYPFEPPSLVLNTMPLGFSPPVKSGAQTAHYFSQFPAQQHRVIPDTNAALNQGGYYENWFNF